MTVVQEQPHDKIFNLLFNEDELTWQNIIYDLIRSEEMNPWDINITTISQKFIGRLKELKEMDFRISGKVVLASAMLLRMKTNRLMDEDMLAFDNLVHGIEDYDDSMDLLDELSNGYQEKEVTPPLRPRTPQPRKRKVSVFDLVEALEKALNVQNRRKKYLTPDVKMVAPKKGKELTVIMSDVYDKILTHFGAQPKSKTKSNVRLSFEDLIPSDTKEDRVYTFIPLLHLENQAKVNMDQQEHFGDIFIDLVKKK